MKAAKRTEIKNLLDFEEEKERPIETKKAFQEINEIFCFAQKNL